MDTLVPPTLDFQLGYFSGKQCKKHWLIEDGDLKEMYAKDSKKSIFLWCDSSLKRAASRIRGDLLLTRHYAVIASCT